MFFAVHGDGGPGYGSSAKPKIDAAAFAVFEQTLSTRINFHRSPFKPGQPPAVYLRRLFTVKSKLAGVDPVFTGKSQRLLFGGEDHAVAFEPWPHSPAHPLVAGNQPWVFVPFNGRLPDKLAEATGAHGEAAVADAHAFIGWRPSWLVKLRPERPDVVG